ncbi:MAG: type IV pilin protein [Isosphaerales bacterium]
MWIPISTRAALPGPASRRGGFTIIEVTVVLTLMAILLSLSAPLFQRAVEQSKADLAVANLRAIWVAERAYWLDNRAYVADLSVLQELDLIDPALLSNATPYAYAVSAADASVLQISATRTESSAWRGSFTIDQNGLVAGAIQADGQPAIVPSSQ